MRIKGRPYTTIERTLVERMISVILQDLINAFGLLCQVNFVFDRLETNPQFWARKTGQNTISAPGLYMVEVRGLVWTTLH